MSNPLKKPELYLWVYLVVRVDMHLNLSQNNYEVANPINAAFRSAAFSDLSQKSLNTSSNADSSLARVSNFLPQISILQDTSILSRTLRRAVT